MPEHDSYALNFIEASAIVKAEFPLVHISGGLSNLSFSFRSLDELREAFHSVFLYHAIKNGMDMGIVNAGKLPIYDQIDVNLRSILEEVVLNKSEDGGHVQRLIAYAQKAKEELEASKSGVKVAKKVDEWR